MKQSFVVKIKSGFSNKMETLRYYVDIERTEKRKQYEHIWQINKYQFFVGDTESANPVYALATACAALCYPIHIVTDDRLIIKDIADQEKIKARFSYGMEQLGREYAGDFAENYIQSAFSVMQDKTGLTESLFRDLWIQLFFAPFLSNKDVQKFSFFLWKIPVLNTLLSFEGRLSFLSNEQEDCDTLRFEGFLNSEGEKINGEPPVSGRATVEYSIQTAKKKIKYIKGNIEVETKEGVYITDILSFSNDAADIRTDALIFSH